MGKKEEDEIIRIAKKMDKMAQKKNGVRMNAYLPAARLMLMWMLANVRAVGGLAADSLASSTSVYINTHLN